MGKHEIFEHSEVCDDCIKVEENPKLSDEEKWKFFEECCLNDNISKAESYADDLKESYDD